MGFLTGSVFAVNMPGRSTSEQRPDFLRVLMRVLTAAGIRINPDEALKTATVWACVTYLSRMLGQLPWRVMEPEGDDGKRAPNHPLQRVIGSRSNPEMGAFTWRETMVGWASRWGNAVAEIQTDQRGIPIALWPLHPSRMQFERDVNTGELLYCVNDPLNGKVELRAQEVFHLRGFGEGAIGLNVIAYAAESIGWAQATETFGSAFFGQGINPSGVVTTGGTELKGPAYDELKKQLDQLYKGPRNAQKALILDGQMKFEKLSVEPDNAQFIETRQHQVEEICRWFGVPPHKVMHLLRATFTNIEHQSIEVVVDCLTPWCKRFEEEADFKLFGANRVGFYTKLDLKGLLRGDFFTRQQGLQIMRRNGVINANQWLQLEDMNTIGKPGDIFIVEGNMTKLEDVGKQMQAKATTQTSPGAAEPQPGEDPPPVAPPPPKQRKRVNGARTHS